MSINDVLKDRLGRGMLQPLIPRSNQPMRYRALLMTERFQQEISEASEEYLDKVRRGELRADLETFITQPTLDHKYLFWLHPLTDCVWEIRSVREEPTIRVLGFFPEKDVFIATNINRRDELGGWESEAWKQAKRDALAQWRVIFHTYQPLGKNGEDTDDFFSGAIPGKFFK